MSKLRILPKKAEQQVDSIGLPALNRQMKYDDDGLVILDDNLTNQWTVGDFFIVGSEFERQAKTATDNATRVLLAAYDRGLFDQVRDRLSFGLERQTKYQMTTGVTIAKLLRDNGLPIKGIEAIRSHLGVKRLTQLLGNRAQRDMVKEALVLGEARSNLIKLKKKLFPNQTVLDDIVSETSVQDVRFEEYVYKLFKRSKPEYTWKHTGKNKHSELGIDVVGERRSGGAIYRIGIQVKCYDPSSYVNDYDWRDFLAGCTLNKINEIYFITTGKIGMRQETQARMADITMMGWEQLDDMADSVDYEHFRRE